MSGYQEQRREGAKFSRAKDVDALPPHSEEAERGVLGCVLLDPARAGECLKVIGERFGSDRVFYDLRHQRIMEGMLELHGAGAGVDVITVQQWLKDRNALDQVGGVGFLNELADGVPSAEMLPSYLDIVWEKFLARSLLQTAGHIQQAVREKNGVDEATLARVGRIQEEFATKSQRGAVSPQYLKRAGDFGEEFMGQFFRTSKEEPGLELPIPFPLRIRRQETTLVSGDDKSGKSTLLSYFALHLAAQGEKVVIASFEMPPPVSLWMLASQLLGVKRLPDSDAGHKRAFDALAWLNERFLFYNFLGISDWRDVLDTFRYAAKQHGASLFILDSVMRIGIPDDDYAQQALAAAHFAQFAMTGDAHMFYVIHENKGEGKAKAKIRGSKLWSANANNIIQVERNLDKGEKAGKVEWNLRREEQASKPDGEKIKELQEQLEGMRKDWDSHMVLRGQRFPGSQQNASKRFWFDNECFQFRAHWQDPAVCWLDRWKANKGRKEAD